MLQYGSWSSYTLCLVTCRRPCCSSSLSLYRLPDFVKRYGNEKGNVLSTENERRIKQWQRFYFAHCCQFQKIPTWGQLVDSCKDWRLCGTSANSLQRPELSRNSYVNSVWINYDNKEVLSQNSLTSWMTHTVYCPWTQHTLELQPTHCSRCNTFYIYTHTNTQCYFLGVCIRNIRHQGATDNTHDSTMARISQTNLLVLV